MPKYPHITVELAGQDGNAMVILGLVTRAMKRAGLPEEEMDAFAAEARSGNYDHLLQTCMAWVSVVG
jgi:hypothetical protein